MVPTRLEGRHDLIDGAVASKLAKRFLTSILTRIPSPRKDCLCRLDKLLDLFAADLLQHDSCDFQRLTVLFGRRDE